ncbi:AraC family transcriptional regulator [Kribbella sp. NPDC056861]|uniref:AraC family transcriptional regulator n=1 Tax=Kribbella sp. NPDC056861 TaxID=3154857 RepID=UPI00342C6A20
MPETLHEYPLFAGSAVLGAVHLLTDDVAAHTHDFVELAVVGPGEGRHLTSRGEHALHHGDVIVLRPGAWHAFADCEDLTVANCCVSTRALRAELAGLREFPAYRRLLWTEPSAPGAYGVHVAGVDPAAATEAIAAIAALEGHLERNASPGRLLGHLATILGILADARVEADARAASRTPAAATSDDTAAHPAVLTCIASLEADPAKPWRLDDLAAAVTLDPAYLGRLFRKSTGLSPLDYLARLRAERAAALLANSDLPIARVGAEVGWPDPTYFARRFRTIAGLTPTEYRRRSAT